MAFPYTKKGSEPVNIIAQWQAEIERYSTEIAELQAKPARLQGRIDELALAAETGSADALSEIAALEREMEECGTLTRRKDFAQRQLRKLLYDEQARETRNRDIHLRKKMAAKSTARDAIAKDIERHARGLVESIAGLQRLNAEMHAAWGEAWPFRGPALTYPDRVNKMIGHQLYVLGKELRTKLPVVEYSESDWSGLRKKFQEANAWIKQALTSDEPAPAGEAVTDASPAAEPGAQATEPHVFTDAELIENERKGNPLNLPLSGREWQRGVDHVASTLPVVTGADFDPLNI